jgi:ferric-dicitrate binding protein FerR (iron transport regulator)
MTDDRFQILADTYGGDIDRWPADERDAARAWCAAHGRQALAVLEDAAALDLALDMAEPPPASPILRDRIIASALQARRPARRGLLWASATGLIAACAAGVIMGAQISDQVLSDPAAESVTQTATAFNETGSYFDTTTTTNSPSTGTAG